MDISDDKFNIVKHKAKKLYKEIGQVKCPYFNNEPVHFNEVGFKHIFYKTGDITRKRDDQYVRLNLLPLAKRVIAMSHTLQQYYETRKFERVRSNSTFTQEMKLVKYWGFMAIINNALIKVVVKEVDGRNKNFYSIIPKWTVSEKNGQKIKILHTGNLEED